jgi:hypothetical protein
MTRRDFNPEIDNVVGCHTTGTRRTRRVPNNERRPR